jgi:hypothetical protein
MANHTLASQRVNLAVSLRLGQVVHLLLANRTVKRTKHVVLQLRLAKVVAKHLVAHKKSGWWGLSRSTLNFKN